MIPRFVLTGGPCGGKTTAVEYLRESLPKHGVTPIIVPELATMLYGAGIRWPDIGVNNDIKGFRFQVGMITAQIAHEDTIFSFAHLVPGAIKVMICDRGTIDNMAYAKDEWHEDILSQVGSLGYLKRRYEGIIHLATLAYGGDYVLDNPARYEDRESAIRQDMRTFQLWNAGPKVPHVRIDHSASLEEKLQRVEEAILKLVL
jgi:hypothetical protein